MAGAGAMRDFAYVVAQYGMLAAFILAWSTSMEFLIARGDA